ncbi:ectoine/hydroxyectoine ABC transporter permease subunit EhuD [Oceanobacillus luteolus]|uniref:Ectoine/hydroxyectoine ABC transporter permease subunit EhuD n=1 Tax=Oceanobacillus luteolus TaxID=1274358 RepID=A0ABW4HM79_9BACI|nr:ectoine/hydroxyectoine ABC transporter permease subunit EhuD [Oceanobacillus luteolus]MCM3740490.1 ectoine/hydroxyectoine ABC transporter permease subunit EhuD [Oceanobacillus luteolus]
MNTTYWSWERFFEALPIVLDGLWMTIFLTFASFAFALIVGFIWTLLRRIPIKPFNWIVTWSMEFIRSTPPLVQLFFIFFALPVIPVIGITLSPVQSAILGLGLHYSTYISEIYRSGIDSVGKGQWEAAKALNFSTMDKWKKIILPQAIPPTVPMLGNYLIILFKEVPLVSTITVSEILLLANTYGSRNFAYLEPLTIVGIIFLVLSYASAFLIKRLELRLNKRFDKNALAKSS